MPWLLSTLKKALAMSSQRLPGLAAARPASMPSTTARSERAVVEGIEAGLAAARPGNRCEDIANAFFKVLSSHGIEKNSRCGYPIGASYPPDWGERTMSLRPGDRSVL